ncbi:MAG: GvpL/GvpF family gas vesicle protein, partial [Ignavibacteria bacterium]
MIKAQENIKEGKYIYGIIRSDTPMDYGMTGIGDRQDRVYTVNYKDIGAIVSRSPVVQYQARRAELMAHEKVLEEA